MRDGKQAKYERMTTEPVERLVCRLAVPTIISMLVTALYNIADTFFVGKIGTAATAGVGLILPIMSIIQAFGFFGRGLGILFRARWARRMTARPKLWPLPETCARCFSAF